MNIDTFVKQVEEQFFDMEPGTLKKDSHYKEIPDWCSLIALSIIAMVDENYSKTLSGDDFKNTMTLEDLFILIGKK